jgi:hypothetical protein
LYYEVDTSAPGRKAATINIGLQAGLGVKLYFSITTTFLNCMFFYCRIPKNTYKGRNTMFVRVIVRIRGCRFKIIIKNKLYYEVDTSAPGRKAATINIGLQAGLMTTPYLTRVFGILQ